LTLKEVAELTRYCSDTIRAKVRRGEFPQPCRMGHKWIFNAAKVYAHLEDLARAEVRP
jgi:excisionase family DNA binding protein